MLTIDPGRVADEALASVGEAGGGVLGEVHRLGQLDHGDVPLGVEAVPRRVHDDLGALHLDGGDLGLAPRPLVVLAQPEDEILGALQLLELLVLVEAVGGRDDPLRGHQGAAAHEVALAALHPDLQPRHPRELVDLGLDPAHDPVAGLHAALARGRAGGGGAGRRGGCEEKQREHAGAGGGGGAEVGGAQLRPGGCRGGYIAGTRGQVVPDNAECVNRRIVLLLTGLLTQKICRG